MFVAHRLKFEIRNPKSAITLTEVLVSMGVLTIGLLGVAALFPVGGHFMRTGEVADRASAIAQEAFAEVVARDMLNPDNWMTHASFPGQTIAPFGVRFSEQLRNGFTYVEAFSTRGMKMQQLNRTFGSVFFIDPLGVGQVMSASQRNNFAAAESNRLAAQIAMAPAEPDTDFALDEMPAVDASEAVDSVDWSPWRLSWPVRRLSLATPNPQVPGGVVPMSSNLAESIFFSDDDLAADFDSASDQPARQTWQTDLQGHILARQSRGDYSWIVTVAPADAAARNALASNDGGNYFYNVSVVVFHKRVIDDLITSSESEKMMRARVISKSLSGGEVVLEKTPALSRANFADLFTDLKAGQWVMLCGPSPLTTFTDSNFVMHWYRVLSVEGEDEPLGPDGTVDPNVNSAEDPRRLVALRGPAWPWEPARNARDNTALSNDLRLAVFPGAVAVHTRTMRLNKKPVWSAN